MFSDREEAGRRLAAEFQGRKLFNSLVLAIPRGGVVIGAALAKELGAELDVVLVRKLRAPDRPELAIGAVSEDGRIFLNQNARRVLDLQSDYLSAECDHELDEIERRKRLIRATRPKAQIAGRSVIVVDEGVATGSTMIASLQLVRSQNPRELIVAVPVAPAGQVASVRKWCDDLICILRPDAFQAIAQFYDDFTQVDDRLVVEKLTRNQAPVGTKLSRR
jgi:putative phosphoribosyl transferase